MPATNTDAISKGILKAQALYAAYLGKQQDQKKIAEDADKKIAAARARFEKIRDAQLKTSEESQVVVEESKQELIAWQEELRETTGAIVNLLDAPAGGRTNL